MKCPKCGYNSFESQDTCKKCSNDLSVFKMTYGLKPIVLQQETRIAMAEALAAESAPAATEQQSPEQPSDIFSFDLPEEEPAAPGTKVIGTDDFFSFSDQPSATPTAGSSSLAFDESQGANRNKSVEDAFASLLESSGDDPFAAAKTETTSPVAVNSPGEFDLESFSWDDTPETKTPGQKKPDEDFNSLFGDIDAGTKK